MPVKGQEMTWKWRNGGKKVSVKLMYISRGPGSFLSSYFSFLSLCKVLLFVLEEGHRGSSITWVHYAVCFSWMSASRHFLLQRELPEVAWNTALLPRPFHTACWEDMGDHSSHALNWWDFGPCSQLFQTQVVAVQGHVELSSEGWQGTTWSWSTILALYRILSILIIEIWTHFTQLQLLWTLGLSSVEKKKGS